MGRLYTSSNTTPFGIQHIDSQTPIEDRTIVELKADLMKKSTWGTIYGIAWSIPMYRGMQVLVACDPIADNNGLYWFKKSFKTTDPDNICDQLMNESEDFDTTELTFDDYWEKVGGGSQVEIDTQTILRNPTGKFIEDPDNPGHYIPDTSDPNWDQDHSDDNQIWVNQVNGGNW